MSHHPSSLSSYAQKAKAANSLWYYVLFQRPAGRHVLELEAGEGERRFTEGERHDDEIRILTFFMR